MIVIPFWRLMRYWPFFHPMPVYYHVHTVCQCAYHCALSRTDAKSSLFNYVSFLPLICLPLRSDGVLSDLKDLASSLLKASLFHVWKLWVNESLMSTVKSRTTHLPDHGLHLVPNIKRESRVAFSKIAVRFLKWFPAGGVE